jgi:hypothetical protein
LKSAKFSAPLAVPDAPHSAILNHEAPEPSHDAAVEPEGTLPR